MRTGLLGALMVLGCSHATPQAELCDLNEIVPTLGAMGWNESRTELVEKPVEPILIPCTCEIDPFLASIADRDPVADARSSFASGSPHFVSLPTLGGALFFESEVEPLPDLPSRPIPGADEGVECYERERLERFARRYAGIYNNTLADLVNGQ